jgi:hypothetical protein
MPSLFAVSRSLSLGILSVPAQRFYNFFWAHSGARFAGKIGAIVHFFGKQQAFASYLDFSENLEREQSPFLEACADEGSKGKRKLQTPAKTP